MKLRDKCGNEGPPKAVADHQSGGMWPHGTHCDFSVHGSVNMLEQLSDNEPHTFLPVNKSSLGFFKSTVKFNKGRDPEFLLSSLLYEQGVYIASSLCHRTLSSRRNHVAY